MLIVYPFIAHLTAIWLKKKTNDEDTEIIQNPAIFYFDWNQQNQIFQINTNILESPKFNWFSGALNSSIFGRIYFWASHAFCFW